MFLFFFFFLQIRIRVRISEFSVGFGLLHHFELSGLPNVNDEISAWDREHKTSDIINTPNPNNLDHLFFIHTIHMVSCTKHMFNYYYGFERRFRELKKKNSNSKFKHFHRIDGRTDGQSNNNQLMSLSLVCVFNWVNEWMDGWME